MGKIEVRSDSSLEKIDNFVPKFIVLDELQYDATHEEVIDIVNVLIEDYKARYHD